MSVIRRVFFNGKVMDFCPISSAKTHKGALSREFRVLFRMRTPLPVNDTPFSKHFIQFFNRKYFKLYYY